MTRSWLQYVTCALVVFFLCVATHAWAEEDGDAASETVTESSTTSWKGKITPSDDEGHRSDVRIRSGGGSNDGLIMIIGGASYDVIEFEIEKNALNWKFDFSGSVFSCNLSKHDGSDAYVGECKGKHVKLGKLRMFEQEE